MLRSLFTGISGLRAHQQMLDITSNNIANVNTVGYKSSSSVFEDTLSQTISGAGAPTGTNGGTNPTQVGLGVQLAGTVTNFGQGSNQYTGRSSDLLINGDGFFVMNNGGQQTYTRAGSFSLDAAGHLVSPDGSKVQSAAGGDLDLSALNSGTYVSWSISSLGVVNGVDAAGATTALGTLATATFANPGGLAKVGDTQYETTANSGAAQIGAPGAAGRGTLTSGYLEMSNVDLASELTNLIISERGFQANSRVITTSDEVLQSLIALKN
ncbi:MAG: flagellar hook-basal body complex protein [Actinomycetota bacterium]|nr:flagellar hook-basal body complex protein [Actinomycetota bacterium]MDQ2959229.1 flagellar hook-basal body complex protein [Actinomycetota bacterium]